MATPNTVTIPVVIRAYCPHCKHNISGIGPCEWCGWAQERQRVLRERNNALANQQGNTPPVSLPHKPDLEPAQLEETRASLLRDAPAMRARAERAARIGGDQQILKQLARDVLVLLEGMGYDD